MKKKQRRGTSAAIDGTTRARGKFNVTKYEKIDHDSLCLDTTLETILEDIKARKRKLPVFPFTIVVLIMFLGGWLFLDWMAKTLTGIFLFPGGAALLLWNVWKLDYSRRHAKLTYRFAGRGAAAFEQIKHGLSRLESSKQILMLTGVKHFEDTRYSGGSASLPEFQPVRVDRNQPPLIDLAEPVWHLRCDRRDIYFMPDHLLIYEGAQIGGLSYARLNVTGTVDRSQVRGSAKRTEDCTVVGETYRFVNNDGTPDKRFNNNLPVPIVEYGVFSLSGLGLDLRLYASNQMAGKSAHESFEDIQRLAGKPIIPSSQQRRERRTTSSADRNIYAVVLDAMCCVVVADGKATKAEKSRVHDIMRQLSCPWGSDEIDSRISRFFDRVRDEGFRSVLEKACGDVARLKGSKNASVLLRCLTSVAAADGTTHHTETKVVERIRRIIG